MLYRTFIFEPTGGGVQIFKIHLTEYLNDPLPSGIWLPNFCRKARTQSFISPSLMILCVSSCIPVHNQQTIRLVLGIRIIACLSSIDLAHALCHRTFPLSRSMENAGRLWWHYHSIPVHLYMHQDAADCHLDALRACSCIIVSWSAGYRKGSIRIRRASPPCQSAGSARRRRQICWVMEPIRRVSRH